MSSFSKGYGSTGMGECQEKSFLQILSCGVGCVLARGLVGFRAWEDECSKFKAICEMRTTPTAERNRLMHQAIADYEKEGK